MNRPQAFQPMRHYTSALLIRRHTPVLKRQGNGTDCGIFTLLYQQTVSNWYGAVAGQAFTDAHIQELLNALRTITQDHAGRHREWVRIHMHTWWRGNWEGEDPVTPTGQHQRQVQRRRHRRRAPETCILEGRATDHSPTRAADTEDTRTEPASDANVIYSGQMQRNRRIGQRLK